MFKTGIFMHPFHEFQDTCRETLKQEGILNVITVRKMDVYGHACL